MDICSFRAKIGRIRPEMLSRDGFVERVYELYRMTEEGVSTIDVVRRLSSDERDAWFAIAEAIHTATVGQLIGYLKENFKPTDRICYMDCVEGCRNDCTYVTKDQLGSRFFYYVKDPKSSRTERNGTANDQNDIVFPYVGDDDVVVA